MREIHIKIVTGDTFENPVSEVQVHHNTNVEAATKQMISEIVTLCTQRFGLCHYNGLAGTAEDPILIADNTCTIQLPTSEIVIRR